MMTGRPSPKIVLNAVFLIGFCVMAEIIALLIHQLGNARFAANAFDLARNLLGDLFMRHSPLEAPVLAAGCYSFWRMIRRIVLQAQAGRRWDRYVSKHKDEAETEYYNSVYRHWSIPITVVRDCSVVALTKGLFRPQIVLSTGLAELLTAGEIEAVLLHERYHCRHRHAFTKFAVQLMIDGMGYIPIVKGLGKHYFVGIELHADRYAMEQLDSSYAIGSALLKLARSQHACKGSEAVHFAETGTNYRIVQIVNPEEPVRIPIANVKSAFLSVVLLALMPVALPNGCPIY